MDRVTMPEIAQARYAAWDAHECAQCDKADSDDEMCAEGLRLISECIGLDGL